MMKKLFLTCMALLSLLGAWAVNPVMPTLSTSTDEHWYYIQFLNGNAVIGDQGTGNNLLTEVCDGINKQLWKIEAVPNTTPTQYMITSKLGNKINWNGTTATYTSSATATGLILLATTNTTYSSGWELKRSGQSNAMNQVGGAGIGRTLGEWSGGDSGNPLVFNTIKDQLQIIINEANNIKAGATEGTAVGNYPPSAVAAMVSAISTAQSTHDSSASTETNCFDAIKALRTAINTFKSSVVLPILTSTALAPKWYYINNVNRPANGVITIDPLNDLSVAAKETTNQTAAQMFRFERVSGVPGVRIINAMMQNGEMLSTASPVLYGTPTNTTWTFKILKQAGSPDEYNIQSNDITLHSDAYSNLVSWAGGYGEASAWTFTAVNNNSGTDEQATLGYMITAAQNVYNSTTGGATDGTYPMQARTGFDNAIQTAISYNNSHPTDQQGILKQESDLNMAITTYVGSIIYGSSPLRSTVASPVWYVLQNQATGGLRTDAVISAFGNVALARKSIGNPTDSIMWRVDYDATAKKYCLINKLASQYLSDYGVLSTDVANSYIWYIMSPAAGIYTFQKGAGSNNYLNTDQSLGAMTFYNNTDPASQFKAISGITVYKNAMKTTLDSINTAKVSYTIGTAVGQYPQRAKTQLDAACTAAQTLYDNASATYDQAAAGRATLRAAWKTFLQSKNMATGLNPAESNPVIVYSKNNTIIVTGNTTPVKAFTITGTEVDITKPVNSGVYIVKTSGESFKVTVQ